MWTGISQNHSASFNSESRTILAGRWGHTSRCLFELLELTHVNEKRALGINRLETGWRQLVLVEPHRQAEPTRSSCPVDVALFGYLSFTTDAETVHILSSLPHTLHSMPDPLQFLPNELWNLCIQFAVDGQIDGPLRLIMVSKCWESHLLGSPSLWSRIYLQNGEDEMARITAFLHLSKDCRLHVDITTIFPNLDSVQLIAENISRVKHVIIRPSVLTRNSEQWGRAASDILARLLRNSVPADIESTSCFGISHLKDEKMYYSIVVMQLTVRDWINISQDQNHTVPAGDVWKPHVTR